MSSTAKVFAILDLFTQERPVWQPDAINEVLGYSRPTGYRYVKELVEAGMLQKVAVGHYALGGRIIELDFHLRQTDPVLLAAGAAMQKLTSRTGFDSVLTVMFAGPRIIDVHRVSTDKSLRLPYGRGRPRPAFRSGAPKILMAGLTRGALLRIYESHVDEIALNGMGKSWPEFRMNLAQVRKDGFYRSIGELTTTLGSLSVPVFNPDDECVAALAVVGSVDAIQTTAQERVLRHLREAADAIRAALVATGRPSIKVASRSKARSRNAAADSSLPTRVARKRRAA